MALRLVSFKFALPEPPNLYREFGNRRSPPLFHAPLNILLSFFLTKASKGSTSPFSRKPDQSERPLIFSYEELYNVFSPFVPVLLLAGPFTSLWIAAPFLLRYPDLPERFEDTPFFASYLSLLAFFFRPLTQTTLFPGYFRFLGLNIGLLSSLTPPKSPEGLRRIAPKRSLGSHLPLNRFA